MFSPRILLSNRRTGKYLNNPWTAAFILMLLPLHCFAGSGADSELGEQAAALCARRIPQIGGLGNFNLFRERMGLMPLSAVELKHPDLARVSSLAAQSIPRLPDDLLSKYDSDTTAQRDLIKKLMAENDRRIVDGEEVIKDPDHVPTANPESSTFLLCVRRDEGRRQIAASEAISRFVYNELSKRAKHATQARGSAAR